MEKIKKIKSLINEEIKNNEKIEKLIKELQKAQNENIKKKAIKLIKEVRGKIDFALFLKKDNGNIFINVILEEYNKINFITITQTLKNHNWIIDLKNEKEIEIYLKYLETEIIEKNIIKPETKKEAYKIIKNF